MDGGLLRPNQRKAGEASAMGNDRLQGTLLEIAKLFVKEALV